MNTIINDPEENKNVTHQTVFGFPTKNVFASKSLNLIYIVVMIVSIAFAYHALGLILTDWGSGLVFLSSIAVVGLPYCIKIIMYGKDEFTHQIAILCILISLLPTIFDFVGLYSETSIKQQLMSKKFEVLEIVNFFDKQARVDINNEILSLNNLTNKKITEEQQLFNLKLKEVNDKLNKAEIDIEQKSNSKFKLLNERINKAQQAVLDETKGVRGKSTSGIAGSGPRSIELESDLRKEQSSVDLDKKELEDNKAKETQTIKTSIELEIKSLEENHIKELDRLKKENENKLNSLKEAISSIDNLLGDDGLVVKANKAKTLNELAEISIKLNTSINIISSKLKTEPKYIKFESDDIIQLSFGALFRGEITAIVCFLLALLLEIVDTIIEYIVRYPKLGKNKEKKDTVNNLRSRTSYHF